MRKVIVYIATSADGYIARPDGDVAWLDRPRPAGDYGMAAFYRSIDTVIMGRRTYDVALSFGQRSYSGKQNYIFSRTRHRTRTPKVAFVCQGVGEFATELRRRGGKDIWLVGGAQLIGAFLDAGQIDEFIIHTVPVLIGTGIPLIDPRRRAVPLVLRSARSYPDGVVRHHYTVPTDRAAEVRGRGGTQRGAR